MKPITSAALDLLDRVLGLPKGGVQTPQLDDGNVVVNLPLGPEIVRRSRTLGGSTGWFFGILHLPLTNADSTLSITGFDPYDTGTSVPPYVDPLPADLEVWIEGISLVASLAGGAGIGDFIRADVRLDPTANQQAFGVDSAGGAVLANPAIPLAYFDTILSSGAPNIGQSVGSKTFEKTGVRIARGNTLQMSGAATLAAGETMTLQAVLLLGVFPVGMGSDVAK